MGSKSFPYDSLAQMPAGDFWARPSSLGLSAEEAMAVAGMGPEGVNPQIRDRVLISVRRAAYALNTAEPGAAYLGKPS